MVRLTGRPDMTIDVYRGRKTTMQQQQQPRAVYMYETWFPIDGFSFNSAYALVLGISILFNSICFMFNTCMTFSIASSI